MPPSRVFVAVMLLLLVVLLPACERGAETVPADTSASGAPAPPRLGDEGLTVSAREVRVRIDGAWYELEVPWAFVNRRTTPVSNPGCNPPREPHVEWWDGGAWRPAYLYGSDACRSASFIVPPGARHASALRLRLPRDAADTTRATRDVWFAPPDAWFRLVWDLHEPPTDPDRYQDGPAIPERERTSAPFRLPRP